MVVVTGVGLITAIGNNAESAWKNICDGKTGISEIPYWNNNLYKTKIAGVIKDFNRELLFPKRQLKRLDCGHQFAIASAKMAIKDANLNVVDRKKVGIFLGTSLTGINSGHAYHLQVISGQKKNPTFVLNYPMSVLLDKLTEEFEFLGPRCIISTACTASTIAIAQAFQAIKSGQIDCALVGGVDPLTQLSFAGFSSMQNMSSEPCAPFSTPIGLNLGEGAGMMILESLSHANQRKARIYAEIGGYALSADAYHPTSPDTSAMSQKNLLIKILDNAGETKDNIDYINLHGTATAGNDLIETKGIKLAFSDLATKIYVSSSKGALGHTLGAAGAIEAIITILSVYNDFVPPTANFKSVRQGCDLNHVKNSGIKHKVNVAITQNFAFGGNNAAILIRKPKKNCNAKNDGSEKCVITGFDFISPIGIGKHNFLRDQFFIKPPIDKVEHSNCNGYYVKDFNAQALSTADLRRSDRIGALTVCVAEMAFKDAQVPNSKDVTENTGIIFGTESGPLETTRLFNEPIAMNCPSKVNPGLFPNTVLNAGTGLASINLKLKGPNIALNVGEASGLRALSYSYDLIKSGVCERLICGGVDELTQFKLDAFNLVKKFVLRRLNNDHIIRKNALLGEGAAAFILESKHVAKLRKANIIAEVLGYSNTASCPKGSRSSEWSKGIFRSMQEAINNAGLSSENIDFICSGSLSNVLDPFELEAIQLLFKKDIPIYNPSKYFGLSAATAPMGLSMALLVMSNQLQLDSLIQPMQKSSNKKFNVCLINSMSMGNNNISLVVKKYNTEEYAS